MITAAAHKIRCMVKKPETLKTTIPAPIMASLRGFEPPTCRLGGGRSILLSYNDKHLI